MANPYQAGGSAQAFIENISSSTSTSGDKNNSSISAHIEPLALTQLAGRLKRELGKSDRVWLSVAAVASLISVAAQLALPLLIGLALDTLIGTHAVDFAALSTRLIQIALSAVIAACAQWTSTYSSARVAYGITSTLREKAEAKLHTLSVSDLARFDSGDLLARVVSDTDQVGDGLVQGLTQLLLGVTTIVGALNLMFYTNWLLALLVIVLTPMTFLAARAITKHSAASFGEQQRLQASITNLAQEALQNHELERAFNHAEIRSAAFTKLNNTLKTVGIRAQFISSLTNPATRLVNNITYAILASAASAVAISSWPAPLTIGQFQAMLTFTNQYMKPFNEISAVVGQVQTAQAAAARIFQLLDLTDEPAQAAALTQSGDKNTQPSDARALSLDFQDIHFGYTPTKEVIHGINQHIDAGKTYALVGTTGCGKTTLLSLFMRFYEPSTGAILLDGTDIATLSMQALRSHVAFVLQDPWIFTGTIAENIKFLVPQANDEQLREAAHLAHADSFIEQMPEGYNTLISQDFGLLSQGQKQLICIARALIARPQILLLDEATSSIDTRTEREVQDALATLMRGRTAMVVAHRLSTIQGADCILMMREGRIIERGTHQELLQLGGAYAKLYHSQFVA